MAKSFMLRWALSASNLSRKFLRAQRSDIPFLSTDPAQPWGLVLTPFYIASDLCRQSGVMPLSPGIWMTVFYSMRSILALFWALFLLAKGGHALRIQVIWIYFVELMKQRCSDAICTIIGMYFSSDECIQHLLRDDTCNVVYPLV